MLIPIKEECKSLVQRIRILPNTIETKIGNIETVRDKNIKAVLFVSSEDDIQQVGPVSDNFNEFSTLLRVEYKGGEKAHSDLPLYLLNPSANENFFALNMRKGVVFTESRILHATSATERYLNIWIIYEEDKNC